MNSSGSQDNEANHRSRLWPVGIIAAVLPLISWCRVKLVAELNAALTHPASDEVGWTLYTFARVLLFALLAVCILRLRSTNPVESPSSGEANEETHQARLFDPLLGLRSLAAFMVLLGHYFLVVFPYGKPVSEPEGFVFHLLHSCPWAAVWVFFTLSGYLMAKGFATGRYRLDGGGVFRFYRNRFFRIYPLYAGAVCFVALMTTPIVFQPAHWWQLGEMLAFDDVNDLPYNPNGALWSISTEAQFYLLVPFLCIALRSIRRRVGPVFPGVLVLFLMFGVAFRGWIIVRYPLNYMHFGYYPLLANLDLFLVGMGLAFMPSQPLSQAGRRALRYAFPAIAALLYGVSTFATHRYALREERYVQLPFFQWFPAIGSILASAYILIAQAVGRVPLGTGLSSRIRQMLTRMGMLTYALYVLHSPIMIQFRSVLHPAPPFPLSQRTSLLYFPFVMALVWLAAELAYRFVEAPFERRKHVSETALRNAP